MTTNSPTYDQQLKLNAKWDNVDKNSELPGSIQAQDRFVRASYYLSKLPQTTDERQVVYFESAVAVEGSYAIIGNIGNALKAAAPITFLAPTTAAAVQPTVAPSAAPQVENKTAFTWWWLLPILALVGALGLVPRLVRRQSE